MTMMRLTSAVAPVSRRRPIVRSVLLVVLIASGLSLIHGFRSTGDRRPAHGEDHGSRPAAASAQQDRPVLEAETRDRIAALARLAERALRAETVDVAWAREARGLILNAAAPLAATTVEDVECRATLCRMRVSHSDSIARASFESDFPIAVAGRISQMLVEPTESDSASPRATLYLARDGHALPDPGMPAAPRGR
jgi:hypothetical protein